MSTYHRVDQRWGRPDPPMEIEGRLPCGQAIVIITTLAVLSWAGLIAIVMGLRAVL
jgi:hypothetical protein